MQKNQSLGLYKMLEESRLKEKLLNHKLAVFVIIAIVIIARAAGVYLLTLPNNDSNSPSINNLTLKIGDNANYTVKTYENGIVTATYPITWNVVKGTYNGTDCLVLEVRTDMKVKNSTTTTIVYWYMDKSTYNGLSMKTSTYIDGVFVSEDVSEFSGPPAFIDPQTIVGHETITVAAGTFACDKVVVADYGNTGNTANEWYSSDVPIGGLVKIETYIGT
jgi:hypothetical protein